MVHSGKNTAPGWRDALRVVCRTLSLCHLIIGFPHCHLILVIVECFTCFVIFRYGVSGFPTIKFFPKDNKDGEEVNMFYLKSSVTIFYIILAITSV